MKFTNATAFPADWTMGFQRDGRERLVAIVKATFAMPRERGQPAAMHAQQLPLVRADQFVGEPGVSAPLRETDYSHAKPACDVLLVGRAHAPPGAGAVTRLQVGLRVGSVVKSFAVVGHRVWRRNLLGVVGAGRPEPFTTMPLGYQCAFGGTDETELKRTGRVDAYAANPSGCGYWRHTERIDGQPLPNTEEHGRPVERHDGDYRPMAFTPVGRHWSMRRCHAGTYDERWLDETAPFWPEDFDERYFQAAPEDQRMPYPQGGESVMLQHLTADGLRAFELPRRAMPVTFIPYRGRDVTQQAALDTVVLEPDDERFTLAWRASITLGRSVFDVKETVVGEMSRAWHRVRSHPHKRYYASLAEAVAARRKGGAR